MQPKPVRCMTSPKLGNGKSRERHVVIEFNSYDAALACYNSSEYQEAQKHQTASSENDIIVIEGV